MRSYAVLEAVDIFLFACAGSSEGVRVGIPKNAARRDGFMQDAEGAQWKHDVMPV